MATAAPIECTRCRRPVVRSEPLWMLGHPYGPKCAKRYGLRPERRVRIRRPARTTGEQPALFDLDEIEINDESEEL